MEKNIAVMRKTIIALTLLVGILIGALIGNPMKKSEASYFGKYSFDEPRGYCFAGYSDFIVYLGKASSQEDCYRGNAVIPVADLTKR